MPVVSKSSVPRSVGIVGRVIGSMFFGVFLAAGLFFSVMMGREIWKDLRPLFWTKTDCVIVESKVRQDTGESGRKWRAEILYRYTEPTTGVSQTSSHIVSDGFGSGAAFDDAGTAYRLVRRFPADSRATCLVEPRAGGEAVLVRSKPWIALAFLFPLIFVAIGGGGIVAMWWRWSRPVESKALSQRPSGARALLFLRGFFFLFFAIGAITGYAFFVRPMWKIAMAQRWPEVPCTIVGSGVKTNHDSDGDTHRVDIHYRYEVAGERFDANRYSFSTGSSSGYKGKSAVAKRYPAGSIATCFVNPSDPTDAVLERGFVKDMWFGLIPAVFCAVGLLGMLFVKPTGGVVAVASAVPSPAAIETGSVTLQPQSSPKGKFIGILIFAAIWNGVVTIMFLSGGEIPWWFKGIFAAVGGILVYAVFYQLLALFNPRPILTVNHQAIPLGGELTLDWSFLGNTRRIQRLHIFLRGTEQATYRRGTDTTTDNHTFTEIEIFNDTESSALAAGQVSVTIPADSMHTFTAPNNKVVWSLHLKGDIPKWPDISEDFPITVLPRKITS